MDLPVGNKDSKTLLWIVLLLLSMFILCVFLDIPIARQVIGFIYLTFVPGFIFLRLLKLENLAALETILFSVGFSLAFLMIAGLLVNEIGLMVGVSNPLTLLPLMITVNSIVLVASMLGFIRGSSFKFSLTQSRKTLLLMLLLISVPIMSVVGALYVNAYENNLILLFMIVAIALLFITLVIFRKVLPSKLYPFAVLMIAIALLCHSSLVSNYLVSFGSDTAVEYFAFKTVQNSAYWSSTGFYFVDVRMGRLNTMLSINVLPTIYSSLLNIDSIWVFKIVFPLIFSLLPLGLYQVWQTRFGRKYAFIAAFLLMAEVTFYTEIFGLNRQIIAELFFVLLLLTVLNKRIKPVHKITCFMIFSFALVVSHYATAEIFLFLISLPFIYFVILKRPNRKITGGMVAFFSVVMFFWYIYTSRSGVFNSFLEFGGYVYSQLGDFLNPTSRGETVLRGLGIAVAPTIWNVISRAFAYLTEALIVVGFIALIAKRIRIHLEEEYLAFTFFSMALLVALVIVPGLANTLEMTRFYHILLFFLAPLCVLGAETIVNLISKHNKEVKVSILLLMVLVPYFLFQTSFFYEVTGSDSWSVSLSKYRMDPLRLNGHLGYTTAYGVFGPQWLSENVAMGHAEIYSDYYGRDELVTYGVVYLPYIELLSNTTEVTADGIIYLSQLSVIQGIVTDGVHTWNSSELHFLDDLNKIYSNGGSEVYENRP
jgi:uncharacterized membrane protein